MLEVRNLSKIYKQKNGTDTHALDNVSLCFPEKGMVFLLGKSGSGKSTLLNVCGGLDAPTNGEIIVKGRSSKNFSQSDFDSYRNTFVGFIFQEYNILNEFTVEDNIALALELQGKPKDKKAIAELLEQVDLTGFAKRKPNTLSGGQKQRIAIARALVKSPEIIMADEPTGALDSATGKQVFDTLKKLSLDKLVIIVSHDREFAELYADRIIELKDGKILSDVTKTQEKQEAISKNVTAIGDILCIKQGSNLTDDDFDRIKSIIKKNSGDIIIAGSEADVQNFKKINRITDDGEKEVFKDTDASKVKAKEYTPEQSRFIRSKLPARHATKIGVSGLKTKPVRLFFTILLCVVSFVLFGVLSTLMLYNNENMFKQTLKDSSHDFVVFDKVYLSEDSYYENGTLMHTYDSISEAKFSSAEMEKLTETFGDGSFGAISIYTQVNLRQASSFYWVNTLSNAAYMPENAFARQNLTGSYPENENEICVSSYFANMLVECKTTDRTGSVINLSSPADLIGKNILLDGNEFKVTGIFNSGEIDPKFDVLKESTNQDYALQRDFETVVQDGTHLLVGLSEEGLEWFAERYGNVYGMHMSTYTNHRGNAYIDNSSSPESKAKAREQAIVVDKFMGGESFDYVQIGSTVYYDSFSNIRKSSYISLVGDIDALNDSEVIVPFNLLSSSISEKINTAQTNISEALSTLYYINDRITEFENNITSTQNELAFVENSIADIQSQIDSLGDNPEELERLLGEKSACEARKLDYLNQIQNYEEGMSNLLLELPEGVETTLETIGETIAAYEKQVAGFDTINNRLNIIGSGQEMVFPEDGGEPTTKIYSVDEREELLRDLLEDYPEFVSDLTLKFSLSSYNSSAPLTEETGYTVVGVIIPTNTPDTYVEDIVYFNSTVVDEYWDIQKVGINYNEFSTKYKDEEGAIYTKLYVPFEHSDAQANYLWDIYSNEEFSEDDSKIGLRGSYIENLQMIDSFVEELSTVFFYVGLVLALFAILLFSNFISVSISQKRREIGILRAVGARSLDVFKIFFSESLVIAGICSVLSIAGSAFVCQILNTELGASLGASIFVFGIASILIIVGIALLTAFLATFLPVWNAAKKKPVDSIRAL